MSGFSGFRPVMHSRNASHESSSSAASAHRLILEHILSYPGTYELPLRTMYALNSAPRTALPRPRTPGAPPSPTAAINPGEAAQQLSSSLMAELSQMPNQPTSLPPAFITSFVRKCLASELRLVDFSQALTALDYLKDLESRRCREMQAVFARVGINRDNAHLADEVLREHPAAYDWLRSLEDKTAKVEHLYSQLYVALRRWMLINEMSLEPFNKSSCIATLNTLFPHMAKPPTTLLSEATLSGQRDSFFKYITAVERSGPGVLEKLIVLGRRADEETGWPSTREILDNYLQTANSMIDECLSIASTSDVSKRTNRKADSGVSFLESRKNSSSSEKSIQSPTIERPTSRAAPHKSSSALEKLAREIRHFKRTKTDVSEMIPQIRPVEAEPPTEQFAARSVRKMKSLSSLNLRRSMSKNGSVTPVNDVPKFDVAEMRKHRIAYDTTNAMTAAG